MRTLIQEFDNLLIYLDGNQGRDGLEICALSIFSNAMALGLEIEYSCKRRPKNDYKI